MANDTEPTQINVANTLAFLVEEEIVEAPDSTVLTFKGVFFG